MRLLLAEDEKELSKALVTILKHNNYSVDAVYDGAEALDYLQAENYDGAILDIMMPKMDGLTVLKKLREGGSDLPVLLLTAKSEIDDKVAGLDCGADDYLTKPFSVDELLARLRATFRRIRHERGHCNTGSSVFENGVLRIDFAAGCVSVDGQELHLAPMEYKLLCLLANNVGKVLTHKTILQAVWGNSLVQSLPALRVFMATLRKKLEAASPRCTCIRTHVGVGYRMSRVED